MKTTVAKDFDDLSRRARDLVIAQLKRKANSVLVFPTGATPLGLFRELVAAGRAGRLDVSQATFVVLDEYAGIAPGDRRSLGGWLTKELLGPLGVKPEAFLTFNPQAPKSDAECARMEAAIARHGGLDLAILGLGPNGHLGFNEPGTPFEARARHVPLSPASIRSNAAYWGSEADVPRTGYTLGLGTLLEARQIVLMVSGAHKAEILARTLAGPPSIDLPATIVHVHKKALVLADRAAMGKAGT